MAEAESNSPDHTVEPSPTADPAASAVSTNIEELQALKAREGNRAAKEQGLRQLLSVLDPHPNDVALGYGDVLWRLQQVIAVELQQQQQHQQQQRG